MESFDISPVSPFKSIALVVPDFDPELTQALRDVASGCQSELAKAMHRLGIRFDGKDIFQPLFQPNQHLPADTLMLFGVEFKKISGTLQKIVTEGRKRATVLGLFFAREPDEDWFNDHVLEAGGIHLDDSDAAIRLYQIPAVFYDNNSIERTMTSIARKALERKAP